jgi:hypothetical protein
MGTENVKKVVNISFFFYVTFFIGVLPEKSELSKENFLV